MWFSKAKAKTKAKTKTGNNVQPQAQTGGIRAPQISPEIQNVSKKIVDYLSKQGVDAASYFSKLIG